MGILITALIILYIIIVIMNIFNITINNMFIDYSPKEDILEQQVPIKKAFNPLYIADLFNW